LGHSCDVAAMVAASSFRPRQRGGSPAQVFSLPDLRSAPDRRSRPDLRSPISFFSAPDRASAPLRRSLAERLPPFCRLTRLPIGTTPLLNH
jgi:hypothetical protein